MKRIDRLALTRRVVQALPKLAREKGKYIAAGPRMPARWEYHEGSVSLIYVSAVLALPTDTTQVALIDVWHGDRGKVLSVSWHPDQQWLPPKVVTLKAGPWMDVLGLTDWTNEISLEE